MELSTDRRPLHLRPGVVAVALEWLAWFVPPLVHPEAGPWGLIGSTLAGLAVLLWWAFFSRASARERAGVLALIVAAVALMRLFLHPSVAGAGMGVLYYFQVLPVVNLALILALLALLLAVVFDQYRGYTWASSSYIWKEIGGVTFIGGGLVFLLDVGRGLSRLLSSEKAQLTLAALVGTPQPLHLILFSKFWAAVAMALPWAVAGSLGSIVLGECDDDDVWQASVAFMCWGISYWNLSAYLALLIRWASFAAALLAMVMLMLMQIYLLESFFRFSADMGFLVMLTAMITAAASFLLWFPLMARLRALAHELG